jgi:flagellar protein FlaG
MDSSLRVRSIGAASAGYARADSSSLRAAVSTELDPSQTVTATLDTPAATDDAPHNAPPLQPMPQDVLKDILIDPQAREVIFRAMAMRAGRPLDETPEEAMLKLKAYSRADRKKRQSGDAAVEKTA